MILDFLGDFVKTPTTNMGQRVLFQQRAVISVEKLWHEVDNFRSASEANKHQDFLEIEERATFTKQRDE
jgi:hypothetical protein